MKANAPKKIYLSKDLFRWSFGKASDKSDIEYTRTDAFIEKACEFIEERLYFEDNAWHIEGEATIKDKVIEDFKNYMKGE